MNESGKYESPFAPVGRELDIGICICCGKSERAVLQIAAYPHKHIPAGWSFNPKDCCEPGDCDTWERTEWFITAQLTGREIGQVAPGDHAIHTYTCMRGQCFR